MQTTRHVWRPTWWREVLYVAVFYGLYTLTRNVGGGNINIAEAERNAEKVVRWQHNLHFVSEQHVQSIFIDHWWFIKFLNVYYGSAHFVVTIGVLIWLLVRQTYRYRHWRNVIFFTTGLALIGYVTFPLAPPRLLPHSYGFVDTMDTIGGLWNFESGAVAKASNQYAAMPSLHVGWSLWCAAAVMPALRHWWSRALMALYPALTITAIVVTANHYWADVLGGMLIFSTGFLLATLVERRFYPQMETHYSDNPNPMDERPTTHHGASLTESV